MNAILEQINSTGKIFVEFALPMLVQSSVLILILLLTDFALRKKVRAVFRYWIWLLVLIKLFLPTSLSSPLSLGYFFGEGLAYVDIAQTNEEPHVTVVDPTPASVPPFIDLANIEAYRHTPTVPPIIPDTEPAVTEPINSPVVSVTPVTWQGAVFLVWLTIVMAMGLLLLQRAIFVRGLVAQAKEANGFMTDTLESCRRSMGVKRKLGLKVSANATSPAVCGLFRPVILVPQNLTSSLSKSQLRAVLLHELAHIRRGDLWVNLAQTFLQIIYFYNPLLWVANCVIRRVREQAVDEMVLVAMGEKARQYPQTLVNVAKMAFKRPALSLRLIGVVESKSALAGRIKHILNRPMPKKAKLGILGLAVVIVTAAILLPMATCTPGPPGLVIKGTVKDAQTGKPIAGARVFDDGYGPKPNWEQIKADVRSEWGAITNSAGEYSFLTWPEHHSIKVEAPGYKSERQSLYDGHFVFNKKDEEIFDFALEPEKILESSGFKKTLPNGVTVELVGVCEHPSKGKQWWRPDGSLVEVRPYLHLGYSMSSVSQKVLEAAFKTNMSDDEIGFTINERESGGLVHPLDDNPIEDIWAGCVRFDKDAERGSFLLGVATGRWAIISRSPAEGSSGQSSSEGDFTWGQFHQENESAVIPVTHNIRKQQQDYRVVAIDTSGNTHTSWGKFYGGSNDWTVTTSKFRNLTVEKIKEFLFQTRPYEWVEFKNVSLRPGHKTDVQVEVEPKVSRLLAALQNEKYVHIREPIIQMVGEIGDKEPISFLAEQLRSENRTRRCNAALALELLGDRRGVPAIIKELNDTSYRPTTRIRSDGQEYQQGQITQDHYYAALLLGILGDERAVPALIEATADETIDYRASMSLGQIGDKRAVPALRDMLDKNLNKPFPRLFAGYGLAMLADEKGLKVVIDTLSNPQLQWTVRRHAIEALGMLGDKQALPHLIGALKDEHPNIRVSAARALGAIGDASALPALEEALKDNTETKVNAPTTVSKAAAEAIAQIKAGDGRKTDVQVETEKPQSLIFHGLDLTAVPHTTNFSKLPDLFEERPLGSNSHHIQKDITAIYSGLDGTVYFIPRRNIFYVQHDKLGSSTLTYYGPFEGNPVQVLNLQADVKVEVEPVVGEWEDIGTAIPADFNDTVSLAEHITLGSIGQDVEGKTFITLLRDREKTKDQQYRFVLVGRNGTLVEPASYSTLLFGDQLWERFSFDMPYQHRQIKEFRLQRFPQNLERKASLPVVKSYDPDVNGKIAAQATSGPPGQGALHFNGKGDYLYVPDSPSLWLGPTFTVEMWIKPEFPKEELENWPSWGLISKGCYIGTGRVKTRGFGVTLHRFNDDPNLLMIDYNTADDNGIYGKSYGRRDFDNWMHLYHVFSPDRYKSGHGYPLVVGKFIIPESPFAGQIGEIRIWRGARSREQISEYRNKPLTGDEPDLVACWTFEQSEGQIAYDISTHRNHARLGTTTDADEADPTWVSVTDSSTPYKELANETDDQVIASSTIEPIGRHALSFDGVDDYLHVAANPKLTLRPPFTIEMWLKPDFSEVERLKTSDKLLPYLSLIRKGKRLFQEKKIQAGGFMMFVGPSSQPDRKFYGSLYLGNADGRLYQVGLSGGDRLQPARPGWIHVSMSCTRETYIPVSDQPLIIGRNIVPSCFPFKGDIAEIRLWSGVRSGDQVARYRNKPLNGNEPGLVACWDFKRPGGQIVFDISLNGNHARLGGSEGPDDADPKWIDLKAASHQPGLKTDVQVEGKEIGKKNGSKWISHSAETNKSTGAERQIVIEARVFSIKTPNTSIPNYLYSKLGIKNVNTETPLMMPVQLTNEQAGEFEKWAAAIPSTTTLVSPKVTAVNGELVDLSLTTQHELIMSYKKPEDTSEKPEPVFEKFTTGVKLGITPELQRDGKAIVLKLAFSKNDLVRVKKDLNESGYEIELPKLTTVVVNTNILVASGKYTLVPVAGLFSTGKIEAGGKQTQQALFLVKPTILNLASGLQDKPDVRAKVERSDKSSESKSSRQAVEKLPEMRGRICGVVVNSVTGEPIAGAYVGVGDFGDSGGSNYSRHRQQGLYAKAQTDEEGRFVLEGVAFRDDHPLVVTHPEFVRHDMKVAVQRGGPEPEIKVSLRPAAKINVTVVDSNGKLLEGFWLIRLEALDGRHFIPPGRDRHLSSFASSIWIELPKPKMKPDKKSLSGTTGFSFTELDSGEYSIDVIKFTIMDNYTPPPAGMVRLPLDTSNITYYGGIANLKIEDGQAKEVAIKPANYQTSITIKMPDDPVKKPHIPPFVVISRNVGLLLWNDGKAHGPEDHRLGRLQKNALYYNMVVDGDVLTIKNLPPGSYSVFAGPIYFMNAVRMKVLSGREVTVEIPVIQLSEHAKVGLWTFDRKVKPEAGSYSVSDLCELISAKTGSNPRIIAEASIQNEKLKLSEREMSVWDLLETLYLEKGWKLKEGAKKTLVLYPAAKADVQVGVEKH